MVKKIFTLGLCFVASLASVSAVVYTTSCGKRLMSVDREFFDEREDIESYLAVLNEIECGSSEYDSYTITDNGDVIIR